MVLKMQGTELFYQFDRLWKRDPEEAIEYAERTIVEWHTEHYEAAMTMLQRLRTRCAWGNYNEPELFNAVLQRLQDASIISPSAMDFIRE